MFVLPRTDMKFLEILERGAKDDKTKRLQVVWLGYVNGGLLIKMHFHGLA